MAADQWKRRFNGTNDGYQEKYRATKKHLGSTQSRLNMSPHISLEWNENQKQAVAKRDQICISRRAFAPFDKLFPLSDNALADVCAIPSELFELDSLAEVLSYEVWQSTLSKTEMSDLLQFLPKGLDVEQVLQSLLSGDNLHFGNPFLKWSASLCSGSLHPDAVLQNEKNLNINKKAYYSNLQKYHNDMVRELQSMKETWESCMDPENDFVQIIWRSRKNSRRSLSSQTNGYKTMNPEENLGDTSESCSDATDEKASSSDNQISQIEKRREFSKRRYIEDKYQGSLAASGDVLKSLSRPSKVNKLNKCNDRNTDGAKYMSYVKISKNQLQLFKNMKQCGKSFQSRSLNRVLGNLDSFQVRPFEAFEEEERTNLHQHWLQVAKIDLPSAFTSWKHLQSLRCEITKSLGRELMENIKSLTKDEGKQSASNNLLVEKNGEVAFPFSTSQEDRDSVSATASAHSEPMEEIHSVNVSPEVNTVDLDLDHNHVTDKEKMSSPDLQDYTENLSHEEIAVKRRAPVSSSPDLPAYPDNTNCKDIAVNHGVPVTSSPDLQDYTDNLNPKEIVVKLGAPISSSPNLRAYTENMNRKEVAVNRGLSVSSSPDLHDYTENLNCNEVAVKSGVPASSSPDLQTYTENMSPKEIAVNQGVPEFSSPDLQDYSGNLNHKAIPVNHWVSVSSSPDLRAYSDNLNHKEIEVNRGVPASSSPDLLAYTQNLIRKEIAHNHEVPVTSSEYVWPSLPHTIYNTTHHQYRSSNGLSLGHPQVLAESPSCLIDLESNLPEQDSGENMLHIQNDGSLNSYQNQEQGQLFQPFYPGQQLSSYNHEQKQTGLGFQQAGNLFLGNNQLPLQLEPRLKRPNDIYIPPNIQENIYDDGGRYYIPRDWAVNNVTASVPAMQSQSNGSDLLSQNWFSGQPRVSSNWSGLENTCFSNPSIGNGTNGDESLFSVLSHCKELNPHHSSYDHPTDSTEQFMSPRNFSAINGIVPRNNNMLPETGNPLDYMTRHESPASQVTNNTMGWVNLPPQNPALHDLTGRPFLRSWNQ